MSSQAIIERAFRTMGETDISMPTKASDETPYVRMRDVVMEYGNKRILDDVDLDVKAGDLCAVVGPSGCGKSTMLRLVLGQEQATSGTVEVDGHDGGYADSRRGYVQQKYSLYPHLTVLGNVLLGPKLQCSSWRRERKALIENAMEFLRRVNLVDAANKYPHELSGGMQQRVAIVQAMITHPKVLVMDEPFAALDPTSREQLEMFLLELWDQYRMTVFFVTHDITEALFVGTRIVLLSPHGKPEGSREGARIVMDEQLDKSVFKVSDKDSPAFRRMREEVMRRGFSPKYVARREAFDQKFPTSFGDLTGRSVA